MNAESPRTDQVADYSPPCIVDIDGADDEFAVIPAIEVSPR